LAHGARMEGCWINTGEGGVSPHHLETDADLVVQISTAKYGVRDANGALSDDKLASLAALPQVRMSQGAKPGKGGMLPGGKVTQEVADIRGIAAGEDSISPNCHPDIESVSDLLDMLQHFRNVTGKRWDSRWC